jgi:hypothetical protein
MNLLVPMVAFSRIEPANGEMSRQEERNEDTAVPSDPRAGKYLTLCVECGPNVAIDEDGCCVTCGATAIGTWLRDHDPARPTPAALRDLADWCWNSTGPDMSAMAGDGIRAANALRTFADALEAAAGESTMKCPACGALNAVEAIKYIDANHREVMAKLEAIRQARIETTERLVQEMESCPHCCNSPLLDAYRAGDDLQRKPTPAALRALAENLPPTLTGSIYLDARYLLRHIADALEATAAPPEEQSQ